MKLTTLVLPSLNRFVCCGKGFAHVDVGENTQERRYILYSRSPLCFDYCYSIVCNYFHFQMSGRFTGRSIFLSTLVLPSLKQFLCILRGSFLGVYFCAFYDDQISYDPRLCGGMHRWSGAIYCIYIV